LTVEHLGAAAGLRDQLTGKIQQSFGLPKEDAERQLADWERKWERQASDSWFTRDRARWRVTSTQRGSMASESASN